MPHNLTHITAAIRASGRTTTHGAILLAEVDRLTALVDDLRRDCSELYQVVGALAYAPRQFDDQQITKALDNAWAAAQGEPRPHDDLLPFALRASQETANV